MCTWRMRSGFGDGPVGAGGDVFAGMGGILGRMPCGTIPDIDAVRRNRNERFAEMLAALPAQTRWTHTTITYGAPPRSATAAAEGSTATGAAGDDRAASPAPMRGEHGPSSAVRPQGGSPGTGAASDGGRAHATRGDGRLRVLRAIAPALQDLDRMREHAGDTVPTEVMLRIIDKLEDGLRDAGIERTGRPGEPFDPTRHDAIAYTPTGRGGAPVIDETASTGWTIDGEPAIPAKVTVKD